MNIEEILQNIDPEAIARDTLNFVNVRSETGQEGPGSLFLADLMRREGLEPQVDKFLPERPNVYSLLSGTGSKGQHRSLVFNGHTDTIPIGNSNPPGRDGDWIIGRGTEDMKGGLVAMVHAASAIRKAGVKLAGEVWLTGVVGHETPAGKKEGPRRLIDLMKKKEIPADALIIVEGPAKIWSASLGSVIFHMKIESDFGPIHTVKVPYSNNPVAWLAKVLAQFSRWESEYAAAPAHPLCGREQLNIGMVRAGDYPNRLPHQVTVTGVHRWMTGKTAKEVFAQYEELCARLSKESGLRFSFSVDEGQREPFETPREHPLVQALLKAGETMGQNTTTTGMALTGDANLYRNEGGVPTVYYGPAHQTAHSDDERVSVTQLAHCARMYALAAVNYVGQVS